MEPGEGLVKSLGMAFGLFPQATWGTSESELSPSDVGGERHGAQSCRGCEGRGWSQRTDSTGLGTGPPEGKGSVWEDCRAMAALSLPVSDKRGGPAWRVGSAVEPDSVAGFQKTFRRLKQLGC